MLTVRLDDPADWAGFVHAVRWFVHQQVDPADVRWVDNRMAAGTLFDDAEPLDATALPAAQPLALPASFVDCARAAAMNADPARFELLHRLVWRLSLDRRLAGDPLDVDRVRLESLAKAVRREMHKMKAFVRFRKVEVHSTEEGGGAHGGSAAGVHHIAWFEPEHHVVKATAPFFARRFAQMDWAILTPRVSVEWDRRVLRFGPGANCHDAPAADANEALWLAYYASIFNPARVKEAMMKKEMPVRYWKNLPEAALIAPLMAEAPARVQLMIEAGGSERQRRRGDGPAGDGSARAYATATSAPADSNEPSHPATAAQSPESIDPLADRAARCRACPIGEGATQMVWGEGSPGARLMLVGEQPGDREDLQGRPFVGPAGHLLRRAFKQLGWSAERVYITNAVKHFKYELRGKRRVHKTANQREIEICSGWLEAEITAVKPEALVALGATAARSLLGRAVPIRENEGEWIAREDGLPVLIVAHPAALLRMKGGDLEQAFQRWVGRLECATIHVDRRPPNDSATSAEDLSRY